MCINIMTLHERERDAGGMRHVGRRGIGDLKIHLPARLCVCKV
jgi:hypothetical protein